MGLFWKNDSNVIEFSDLPDCNEYTNCADWFVDKTCFGDGKLDDRIVDETAMFCAVTKFGLEIGE